MTMTYQITVEVNLEELTDPAAFSEQLRDLILADIVRVGGVTDVTFTDISSEDKVPEAPALGGGAPDDRPPQTRRV